MRKKYFLLSLCLVGLMGTSCSVDEDVDTIDTHEQGLVDNYSQKMQFPESDGSKDLPSSHIQKVSKLLKAVGPEVGRQKGYYKLTDAQFQEIKAFTDDLVAGETEDLKVYRTIFNWVTANIRYSYDTDNEPYNVFKMKKGVCQGYANLLHVMLQSQNIPVVIVNGMLNPVGGHAWNYVYVDNDWYVSDPTNGNDYKMLLATSYSHLVPHSMDARLFETDEFVFSYKETRLNLAKVKKAASDFVVPYSAGGFVISAFSPDSLLPANVTHLYLGKNIESLGEGVVGLKTFAPNVQSVQIDPSNKSLHSYAEVAYYKSGDGFSMAYVPAAITRIEFPPVEVMGKNYFYEHDNVEELVFAKETKRLEAYAVEKCPKLRVAYVPEGVEVDPKAFYNVGPNFQIVREDCTGIENVTM